MKMFLLMLVILGGMVACTPQEKQKTLVVGTNSCYPPYESINDKGESEGFDIDVAQAIADKLGKKLIIKEFSFDALILALQQGKIDMALAGISITPSRLKEIAMIPYQGEPVKSLFLVFWEQVPEHFSSILDLKTLAVLVGTYQEAYLQSFPTLNTKSLEGNTEIIMDLQYKKSSAALFEPHIAKEMQRKFKQLKLIEWPLEEKDWVLGNGIGMKKGETQKIREIEQAIQELQEEGAIQQLEKKWFST